MWQEQCGSSYIYAHEYKLEKQLPRVVVPSLHSSPLVFTISVCLSWKRGVIFGGGCDVFLIWSSCLFGFACLFVSGELCCP